MYKLVELEVLHKQLPIRDGCLNMFDSYLHFEFLHMEAISRCSVLQRVTERKAIGLVVDLNDARSFSPL